MDICLSNGIDFKYCN